MSRENFIILDTGTIGYRIFVPSSISLPSGSELTVFTHHHVRENGQELYGFLSFEGLGLFEKLISVNGVGPKAGLAILSASEPSKIISAITTDDIGFFTTIPGIGKKVAAKIILDLKKKVSGLEFTGTLSEIDEANDVVDSLVALGYKKFEVTKVLTKLPSEILSIEDKVRWCLKNLAK